LSGSTSPAESSLRAFLQIGLPESSIRRCWGLAAVAARGVVLCGRGKGRPGELGLTVEAMDQRPECVDVRFTDGTSGRYDLVVGADGLFSEGANHDLSDAPRPRFTGQGVWRHNFTRRPEIDHLAAYNGRHASAGLVPLAQDLMYMYVTSVEPGNPRMEPSQLHLLMKDRMKGFGGLIAELKAEIGDPAKVVYKAMEAVLVPPPWYSGRVVLLGDGRPRHHAPSRPGRRHGHRRCGGPG